MSVEDMRHALQQIGNNISHSNSETQWKKTISGRIYTRLEEISKKLGKPLQVENRGGVRELFRLGDETARLYKRLTDGTVGEDGGTLQTLAEGWEYKRFKWWKEALDLEGLPAMLLDIPVSKLAVDANITNIENYFDPAAVVEKYKLNPSKTDEKEIVMKEWVKDQIREVLNSHLEPNYEVKDFERTLRLSPKNPEAKRSRFEDNAPYLEAQAKIKGTLQELEDRYKEKAKTIAS